MKYFIVLAMLLFGAIGWSQGLNFVFLGKIDNFDLGKSEGGVKISIIQNGTVASSQSSSNGKYTLKVNMSYTEPFDIVFSKSGFVSKTVSFDLTNLNQEDIPASTEYYPLEALDMSIFKVRDNVDFSFLDREPVVSFTYDQNSSGAKFDSRKSTQIKTKIKNLLNDAEKKQAKLEADYQEAIQVGDDAFSENKYEEALSSFEEALSYKPQEKYPVDKIMKLDALIQIQKSLLLADKQANAAYYNLIETGDNLRDHDNLEGAISKYKAAIIKKDEQYPKDQIVALTKMLADREKEAEIQVLYDTYIKAGDQLVDEKKFLSAIKKYNEALTLKPGEQQPVDKADEAERLEKSKGRETDAQYEKILTVAENKIKSGEYKRAIELINRAIKFKPEDPRPQLLLERVSEIKSLDAKYTDMMISANALMLRKKYQEAKETYKNAMNVKPHELEPGIKIAEIQQVLDHMLNTNKSDLVNIESFNLIIKEADVLFRNEGYASAKNKYEEAIGINSSSTYAKAKVKECERMESYRKVVDTADNSFNKASYNKALKYYNRALILNNSAPYPKQKISEINVILNPLTIEIVVLEDLGDPFDENNVLDGGSVLQKSESERSFLKTKKIRRKQKLIRGIEAEAVLAEVKSNYNNSNGIYRIQKKIIRDIEEADLDRQTTIDSLRETQLEIEKEDQGNISFENAENITFQRALDLIKTESILDYTETKGVYEDNAGIINSYNTAQAEKAVIDTRKRKDKTEYIRSVRYNIIKEDSVRTEVEIELVLKVNNEIAEVKKRVIDDIDRLSENRIKNNELLKASERKLTGAHFKRYNEEIETYTQNKVLINKEVKIIGEQDVLAKEVHAKTVGSFRLVENKAFINTQGDLEDNEDSRLKIQEKIDSSYVGVGYETIAMLKEKSAISEDLKEIENAVLAENYANNIRVRKKHFDASKKVHNVTDAPKNRSKVANSLGKDYPEGVSQESFSKSDNNGLITTIITRRIVVVDRHADVYIRTQTLSGVTYSKNDKPSLSYVWQNETQASHLERHF
ncbi:MAG: hypothetical protein QNK85_10895 [Crocinitomicaceae bacterium]